MPNTKFAINLSPYQSLAGNSSCLHAASQPFADDRVLLELKGTKYKVQLLANVAQVWCSSSLCGVGILAVQAREG